MLGTKEYNKEFVVLPHHLKYMRKYYFARTDRHFPSLRRHRVLPGTAFCGALWAATFSMPLRPRPGPFVAASWCSHWDRALDLGTKGTRLFQCLFSSLCRPVFGDRVCPLCEREIPSQQNYFDHLNSDHLNKGYGPEVLRNILENDSQSVLDLASCVLSL